MKDKFYRSRKDRFIGGVAGGLAEYMNIDPILVRVVFVLILFFNGFGLLLYIILWIIVPEAPFEMPNMNPQSDNSSGNTVNFQTSSNADRESKGRVIIGISLIVLGILFFAQSFLPHFHVKDIFPITLIIIGIALLWNSYKKK
jgi:phage shock protein PspC (stress-responsive transcriptional regulator)